MKRKGVIAVALVCLCMPWEAAPAADVPLRIDFVAPRNGSVLYFGDETTVIAYRASALPGGAQVRLSINGKEALVSPETEISVTVPGLIVGMHHVAAAVLDGDGAPLASESVHFEMRRGFAWVARNVVVREVASALTCRASAAACSFLIDARGDGSSPATGHFFRVRLVGPAIVMARVRELNSTPGVYEAEYTAVDPGVYSMSVVLLHASHTGVADPGAGVARQFLNQHLEASPFRLRVVAAREEGQAHAARQSADLEGVEDDDAGTDFSIVRRSPGKSWPLCEGMSRQARQRGKRTGAGPPWARGRWVHRDLCRWHDDACQGVASDRVDRLDAPEFVDDPWIWVPHGRVTVHVYKMHKYLIPINNIYIDAQVVVQVVSIVYVV